ncbi:hypothetical protein BJX70DRAFT_404623 [Aspergillus crustosus]
MCHPALRPGLLLVIPRRALSRLPPPPPPNATILAIVLAHAAVVLPLAIYLLNLLTRDDEDDPTILVVNTLCGMILRLTGILTSLTAAIPQIHLMVTRYRVNLNVFHQGSLSLLGLGLQVIAFIALDASQGWRMRVLSPAPDAPSWEQAVGIWSWEWWGTFFFVSGLTAGWVALAVCQLLVLCVALGLGLGGTGEGRIHL